MAGDLEARVVALLGRDPEPTVPLSRLHRHLLAELGPGSITYAELYERLAQRPDLFLIFESREPAWSTAGWPVATRLEYQEALRDAGLEPGPRVALVEPGAAETAGAPLTGTERVLRRLSASLALLWAAAGDDARTRVEMAEATKLALAMRRAIAHAEAR
jgi:hypothetical protein